MKNSSCFINGLFFFTPLHFEVQGIRMEVEHLRDDELIDEISYLCEDNSEMDLIIYNYVTKAKISEEDRESLINFYVLVMIQDYLMIMEEEEL